MKSFWRGGELFVWMTASGVAISLLMVGAMLALIMVNGLGSSGPPHLHQIVLKTQETVIGQVVGHEVIPNSVTLDRPKGLDRFRYRVGNRDVFGSEYRWIDGEDIVSRSSPEDLTFVERREWGPAFGRLGIVGKDGRSEAVGRSNLVGHWSAGDRNPRHCATGLNMRSVTRSARLTIASKRPGSNVRH